MNNKKTLTVEWLKKNRTVPKEILEKIKEDNKIKAMILNAMKDGPKTIPEISKITGLAASTVTWWLMTLRKYGMVIETGEIESDSFYKYKIKEAK
ncbi:MAG: winged helix-turn-helix domain-containing protein [Candidatus Micrarchaeia archaeon]